MSGTSTTESLAIPPQSTESVSESSSSRGKDETFRRRTVQFEVNSPAQKETTSEPVLQDLKNIKKRSSLLKKNEISEKITQINQVQAPSVILKLIGEESEPTKIADMFPPSPGEISSRVEMKIILQPMDVQLDVPSVIQHGVEMKDTKILDSSIQSSSLIEAMNESMPVQQEQESEISTPTLSLEVQSMNEQEISGSPSEQDNTKTDELPSIGYMEDSSNSNSDNEDNPRKKMMFKRGSIVGSRKNRRKFSVLKEIIGSIEKRKGPNLPDKLGFGSSEDRKFLMVESLKERKKSSIIIPKEFDETSKFLDKRKTIIQGLGFGSSEKRKSLFDKEDPLKPKEKRKSMSNTNNKEDDKESIIGKSRRASTTNDSPSLTDPRAPSISKYLAIKALMPQDIDANMMERVHQDMNQAMQIQNNQASREKELKTIDVNQQVSEGNQQLDQLPDEEKEFFPHFIDNMNQVSKAHIVINMEEIVDIQRYLPNGELVGDDEFSEDQEKCQPRRDHSLSIYGSKPTNSNYYDIPLDDNEGLATSLLGGKVNEPMRNELENWLSSAINRVDSNLSSSWTDPVLRLDTSRVKCSLRQSIPLTRTPRNTMVVQPDSSSISGKGLTRCPSLNSLRDMRRISSLTSEILAGTISDENKFLQLEQLSDSSHSQKLDSQKSNREKPTPKLVLEDVTSRVEDGEESHWNQETTENGLRRLEKELEQRAWAQYDTKRAPCLILSDNMKKRMKLGESVDYLHAKFGQKYQRRYNILNKDLLCYYGGTHDPEKLKNARISGLNIIEVDPTDLELFQNLQYLDLSVNQVKMHDLWALSTLRKLNLMSNQMCYLCLTSGQFNHLQALDLSYNILSGSAIVHLAKLPALETLNLDHNSIVEIPEVSGEPCSFNRLRILSATHNFIKTPSLIPLSKISCLEKLFLAYNAILSIPPEIKEASEAFPRLQMLDLTNNKVIDSQKLIPLLQCRSLKQVILCRTPMARKLACNGANRLLDSARATLLHILRAEQAGQSWITKESQPKRVEFEAKMHIILQRKAQEIKLFDYLAEQEMAHVFEYTSDMLSKEAGDKHCGLHKGYTSAILPFTKGFQSPMMLLSETKATDHAHTALSDVTTNDIPSWMDEALESIEISKNLTENHLRDANAAIVGLQNTLGMPFRETNFNSKHYLTMTKSGVIRVNEYRLDNQESISPRKDAVYLAQRFLYQAEVDASAQVHNVLERIRLHLVKMDDVLKETLTEPPPFSPPRRMSEVNIESTDLEGILTF